MNARSSRQIPLMDEIGDPHARRDADFYETFRWQTEALLRRVELKPRWHVVEPCAGELAIARVLRDRGLKVWTNDLVPRAAPLDSTLDARTPELWDAVQVFQRIDLVVTNLPFSVAFEILPGAVERANVAVISLLRSTFDEPTLDRGDWLAAHPPTAQIAMPRADYRNAGSGDSATHHWFIWANHPAFVRFSHDTVTARERDELIALYGKGR